MKAGLRQRMSWLHTWCGLVCAWLLFLIFLAGSLSVFREPITRWMTAEPPLPATAQSATAHSATNAAVLAAAGRYLAQQGDNARFWRIEFPDEPQQALRLVWRTAAGVTHQAAMDPRNGDILAQPWGRKTEGGRHFMTLHYTLHAGNFGFWLVGWLAVGMLVALVSGVIVHKRIFKDFFTFRPGRGQRAWLDGHNASAVLTLPFQLMITYTGLAFFYTSYMPWPLQAVYGDNGHARWQAELLQTTQAGAAAALPPNPVLDDGVAARLQLGVLLDAATTALSSAPRMIMVERPGQRQERITVYARPDPQTSLRQIRSPAGRAVFQGATGAFSALHPADAQRSADPVQDVMSRLHLADFGGWGVKWLYFILGLAGTGMIATGAVLFAIKRRNKSDSEFGALTPAFYRLMESLNVAAIAGACVACIAYFHANRLIPAALPGRDGWEIKAFFLVWLATALHALLRPPQRAWVEQFGCAAALCLTLPLINALSTGQHGWAYVRAGNVEAAWVEGLVLVFGGLFAWLAWRLQEKAWVAPKPGRTVPAPRGHRWRVLGRVVCAGIGGYVLASLAATVGAQEMAAAGMAGQASAVAMTTLLSFLVYAGVAIWVFAASNAWRGVLGLMVLLGCAAWWMGGV